MNHNRAALRTTVHTHSIGLMIVNTDYVYTDCNHWLFFLRFEAIFLINKVCLLNYSVHCHGLHAKEYWPVDD